MQSRTLCRPCACCSHIGPASRRTASRVRFRARSAAGQSADGTRRRLVTPLQMAGAAYAVFAQWRVRVQPVPGDARPNPRGKVVSRSAAARCARTPRRSRSPARNAFVVGSLLQSVVSGGTAFKAHQALQRVDLYGKTGTTNDSFDTWFAGFQPTRVGIAWIGYDTPRQLGVRGETGGRLRLPVWIGYMRAALRGVPEWCLLQPPRATLLGSELYFDDMTRTRLRGRRLASVLGAAAERRRIGRDGAGARCRRAGKAGSSTFKGHAPFRCGHEPRPAEKLTGSPACSVAYWVSVARIRSCRACRATCRRRICSEKPPARSRVSAAAN